LFPINKFTAIKMIAWKFFFIVFWVGVSLVTFSATHAKDLIALNRLGHPIKLDGVIDDSEWQAIDPLPIVMYQPTYHGEMTEQTEIRVAYDDEFLYLAGRLYSRRTNQIRGNSLYRDDYSGDDIFAVVLDTFNDNDNAVWFFTNPSPHGLMQRFRMMPQAVAAR
jgi:hypothetical protein